MPSPPKKTPSDPELEFGIGDDEESLPTGKFTPVRPGKPTPRHQPRVRPDQPTMPAPGEKSPSQPGSSAGLPHGVVRAPARKPSSPKVPEQRITAPAPPTGRSPEPPPDEQLFGTPLSDRPTQEVPAGPRKVGKGKIAPLPPKLPTLGPEPEFSFGIEDPPMAKRSEPPRKAKVSQNDLSWDLQPSQRPGADGESDARPTPVPLALEPQRGDAHSLVERASVPPVLSPTDPSRELDERFALGDFSGALVIAESILAENAHDADAQRIAGECRSKLQAMYTGRLGSLEQVPVMAVPRAELKWLSLDHRAGFVLSLVDGTSTMENIIDVAGMPALEVLRTLYELVVQRVIEFKSPRR
jgi:hypothetical protein